MEGRKRWQNLELFRSDSNLPTQNVRKGLQLLITSEDTGRSGDAKVASGGGGDYRLMAGDGEEESK